MTVSSMARCTAFAGPGKCEAWAVTLATATSGVTQPVCTLLANLTGAGTPTAWTVTRHDGPDHLGL